MPVVSELTNEGECAAFDTNQWVKALIISCKLENIARIRSLVFATSSNGDKITKNVHQVVAGLKIVDTGAIDPMTDRLVKPQSRNACRPTRVVLGK